MYNVLYIGNKFDQIFSGRSFPWFSIYDKKSDDSIIFQKSIQIVVIDVSEFGPDYLVQASIIKSKFTGDDKVFIIIQNMIESVSVKSCCSQGFDDILDEANCGNIELSLYKVSLQYEKQKKLSSKLNLAESIARTALYNSGELGVVLKLLTKLVSTKDINEFSESVISSFSDFDLNACMQIRIGDKIYENSSNNIVKPMESKLLTEGKYGDRILSHGSKYLFNEKNISFLIKNMPLHDKEKLGRLADHLALIVHACSDLILKIKNEKDDSSNKSKSILTSISEFKDDFIKVNEEVFKYSEFCKLKMSSIKAKIQESFLYLDLNDMQVEKMDEIIEDIYEECDLEDVNFDIETKMSFLERKIKSELFG